MLSTNRGDQSNETSTLNAADYLDEDLLRREKQMFRRTPLIVGHSSEVSEAGDFIVRELDNRSWLIVRGKDGQVRAFLNYCQHRGTRLEQRAEGNCKHRLVCPYHAWTYDSAGSLIGVPRADLFPGLDKSTRGLRAGKIVEKFGLLWLTQEPSKPNQQESIDEFLLDLKHEFAALGMADMHVYFDKTRDLQANWKFPIFAFLESYHLAALHKESIGEFFVQNVAHSEMHGRHIRSFVPRQNAVELADADLAETNIAEYITPTNILFPNVCMVGHPTSLSILSMFPGETAGTSTWRHMLLTPHKPTTEAEIAHYNKTIAVLDKMTYQQEDYWVSEQIQAGVNAGAIDEMLLGANEHLLKVFDNLIKSHLEPK